MFEYVCATFFNVIPRYCSCIPSIPFSKRFLDSYPQPLTLTTRPRLLLANYKLILNIFILVEGLLLFCRFHDGRSVRHGPLPYGLSHEVCGQRLQHPARHGLALSMRGHRVETPRTSSWTL
jgi:hypothetical protein